jgi:hypothetical protein
MKIKIIVGFMCAMILVGLLQHQIDGKTNYFDTKNVFVNIPSGKTLRILSFGYDNLVADLLYLWSIQFYSSYSILNRYDYLEGIYNTITDLSPKYYDPYFVGSWIMALEFKDIPMAMRLLDKGAKNLPNEWRFDIELGFYASKWLKDYKSAEIYFRRASGKPGAPSYLKRRVAHMIYMRDDNETAFKIWLEIYQNAKDNMEKHSAFCHLYQIKFEKDKKTLESKIDEYKKIYGKYPAFLKLLVQKKLIDKIPRDLSNNRYNYNMDTGKITAKKVFKWKKFI